mgnify:CR=1 FL=1
MEDERPQNSKAIFHRASKRTRNEKNLCVVFTADPSINREPKGLLNFWNWWYRKLLNRMNQSHSITSPSVNISWRDYFLMSSTSAPNRQTFWLRWKSGGSDIFTSLRFDGSSKIELFWSPSWWHLDGWDFVSPFSLSYYQHLNNVKLDNIFYKEL